jgi:hypothetical protein
MQHSPKHNVYDELVLDFPTLQKNAKIPKKINKNQDNINDMSTILFINC